MVYRISAGLFFLFTGVTVLGVLSIPAILIGLAALVAGVALLAGY